MIDKIIDNKKLCGKCRNILDISKFNKQKSRKNGLQLWCSDCIRIDKSRRYHGGRSEIMKNQWRGYTLKRKYGITTEDYNKMADLQQGKCAICGEEQLTENNQYNTKKLVIDHSHKNGKVRGLLCSECNNGMGKLKDSVEILKKAINYLKKYDSQHKLEAKTREL